MLDDKTRGTYIYIYKNVPMMSSSFWICIRTKLVERTIYKSSLVLTEMLNRIDTRSDNIVGISGSLQDHY